jgi:type VI secretion system protein VasD
MAAHPADVPARRRFEAAGATRRGATAALASLIAVAALQACKSPPKPPPPVEVAWQITAAADLNPSVSNRPSPLRLRVYELRSAANFTDADFMALYNADDATLGKDLVVREEFVLEPGHSQASKKVLNAETQFVAVMAAYRDVEHATWRTLAPVHPGKTLKIEVRAAALAVAISASP